MDSNSPTERPLYSYVVATSRLAHRHCHSETSSSPSSMESDNETAAQRLGIADMGHLSTERFQVDRRKLEKMIKEPSDIDGVNRAERYFEYIMKTTDTFITWPRNLKLGARSRKDPYVRIVGAPDDNNWAKGLILANFAPKGPLLKMKMAISNSDHPHIIGRGGNNINRIMEETETHIHFPDTNRRNLVEKSNQVSLYGTFEGLEKARTALRLSTPLLISFELPVGTRHDTQYIKKVETGYNVKVIFFSTQNPNTYLVLVKGYENEAAKVKEAVQLLLNSMCGFMALQPPVNIQLEICQQYYDITTGEDNTTLATIMESTKTKITFPDPSDMSQQPQITITGTIEGVYEAKQQLMGHLPIELTFDVPDNEGYIAEIMSLDAKYGVRITLQQNQKQRDNTIAVTVTGLEKLIQHIHGAYLDVLDMQITVNEPEIPKAYLLVDTAYRRSLENDINNDHCQNDSITIGIWAPTGPTSESNFLQITPSTAPIDIASWNNCNNEMPSLEPINSPHFEHLLEQEVRSRATLSPDSTSSSEVFIQEGRRSSDWVVMKEAEGPASEDEDHHHNHYECDFDSEDLEVAFIFMSSPSNASPHFMIAPGAERHY